MTIVEITGGMHPQGRETRRPAGAGADQVRPGDQPQDREGARPRSAAVAARPRRRGDRMIATMRRRTFITLVGGALAAWPPAAPPPAPLNPPAPVCSVRRGGAHPQARRAMKTVAMIFTLALVGSQALAQEQTRIYGPNGRSLGTAAPYGTGSVRYRDSRGRTTFTTTTMNGVTRFYDSGGHLTGTVIGSRRH